VAGELERVTAAPGAGGLLLVPHREARMDASVLPADYRAIMTIVSGVAEPVPAKDVCVKLGRGTQPGQVEPVRDKLKRLAAPHARGSLHRAARITDHGRIRA
jgi:hypothetical protein